MVWRSADESLEAEFDPSMNRSKRRRGLAAALAIGLLVVVVVAVIASRPGASGVLERVVGERPANASDAFARAGISASRACVFGPYSTDEAINNALGFAWDRAAATGIAKTDVHELVIAADDVRVIAWALVARPTGSNLIEGAYGCRPIG
jgi:hypothetical protein